MSSPPGTKLSTDSSYTAKDFVNFNLSRHIFIYAVVMHV